MKTNLIFKRQVTVEGNSKVELKVVAVEVPGIESNEGWILNGHADIIDTSCCLDATPSGETVDTTGVKPLVYGSNFISSVPGTAKLVRAKGEIFIAYRRGKSTYNQTAPNSVCIGDTVKNQFFTSCKKTFGEDCSSFKFIEGKHEIYTYWNSFIDQEYSKQLEQYNKKQASNV